MSVIKSHCITISMPKINSTYKLNFKIEHILWSHKLKGLAYPKIIEATFSFPEFVESCKKSVYSNCSLLRYSQFQSLLTRLTTPIFYLTKTVIDQILIFFEHISTCKKSDYFIDFAGDIVHLKILQSDWQRTFWPISQEQEFQQMQNTYRNTANNINHFIS